MKFTNPHWASALPSSPDFEEDTRVACSGTYGLILYFLLNNETTKGPVVTLQPRGDNLEWWLAAGVMLLTIFFTLVGNVGVMVALWRVKRAPSHYPLASLVTADLLVGLAVQPLTAATELFVFKLNRYVCGFWSTMDVLCCTASILSLCALGWERWVGITAPLARMRRARNSRFLAYAVWVVSTLVALPNAFVTSPHHFDPEKLEKGCPVNINAGYVFFSITLSFYLPAVVMVAMYACILRALAAPPAIRAHRGRSPRNKLGNPENNNNEPVASVVQLNEQNTSQEHKCSTHEAFILRQRRATRTIVLLMALFLVCWTPYFIILPLDSLYDCVTDSTWLWCTWLGYANSALNPLVYAARLRSSTKLRSSKTILTLAPRA